MQVGGETRIDRSPTLSQNSRPWYRVPASNDQSFGKNFVNLGSQERKVTISGTRELSSVVHFNFFRD